MQIYMTINLVNNKIYIGKNKNCNLEYFGSGLLIRKAIHKYGSENFDKIILESEIETIELLNEREKYWITRSRLLNKSIMYNITDGGEWGDTFTNHPNKEEFRLASSKRMLGKTRTKESRDKQSVSITGDKNHFYNKQHTDDTKQIMHDKKIGIKLTEEHKVNIGLAFTGDKHPNYQKPMYANAKLKFTTKGLKDKKAKQITVYGITFDNCFHAAMILGGTRSAMKHKCLSNKFECHKYLE